MKFNKKQYDYDFHVVPALASCDSLITPPLYNSLIINYLLGLECLNSGCLKALNGFKAFNAPLY